MVNYTQWKKLINEYLEIDMLLNDEVENRLQILKDVLKKSNINYFNQHGFIFQNNEFYVINENGKKVNIKLKLLGLDENIINLEKLVHDMITTKINTMWVVYDKLLKTKNVLKNNKINKKV